MLSPPVGDGWLNCLADVVVDVTKPVTSGHVAAFINWSCVPGEFCSSFFHGDMQVPVGSTPGQITISTRSGYLQRAKCSDAIPVVVDIYDGSANGSPLLYTLTSVWRGFGCN